MQSQQISLTGEASSPSELAVHATATWIDNAVAVSAENDCCVVLGESLDAHQIESRTAHLFAQQGNLIWTNFVRVEEEPPL